MRDMEESLLLVLIYSLQQNKIFNSKSTAERYSGQTADRNNTAAIFTIMRLLLLFKDCSMEKLSCF